MHLADTYLLLDTHTHKTKKTVNRNKPKKNEARGRKKGIRHKKESK
jgi:hypothetical protein